MSDIRFIMIGIVVITVGFIILGVFGSTYTEITVQTEEFSTCYEYPDDQMAVEIDCEKQFRANKSASNAETRPFQLVTPILIIKQNSLHILALHTEKDPV